MSEEDLKKGVSTTPNPLTASTKPTWKLRSGSTSARKEDFDNVTVARMFKEENDHLKDKQL